MVIIIFSIFCFSLKHLRKRQEWTRYVIKRSVWTDVLASDVCDEKTPFEFSLLSSSSSFFWGYFQASSFTSLSICFVFCCVSCVDLLHALLCCCTSLWPLIPGVKTGKVLLGHSSSKNPCLGRIEGVCFVWWAVQEAKTLSFFFLLLKFSYFSIAAATQSARDGLPVARERDRRSFVGEGTVGSLVLLVFSISAVFSVYIYKKTVEREREETRASAVGLYMYGQ